MSCMCRAGNRWGPEGFPAHNHFPPLTGLLTMHCPPCISSCHVRILQGYSTWALIHLLLLLLTKPFALRIRWPCKSFMHDLSALSSDILFCGSSAKAGLKIVPGSSTFTHLSNDLKLLKGHPLLTSCGKQVAGLADLMKMPIKGLKKIYFEIPTGSAAVQNIVIINLSKMEPQSCRWILSVICCCRWA